MRPFSPLLFASLLPLPLLLVAGCPSSAPSDDDDDAVEPPPAWAYELDPHVDSYIPEDYRTEAPARVVFLGDSITAGAGASGNGLAYTELLVENDDDAWTGWGDYDLRSLYGADFEVVDVSRGGATTDGLVDDQLPALSGRLGDSVSGETAVFVTIGGNDMQGAIFSLVAADDPDAVAAEIIAGVRANMEEMVDYFADRDRFPDGVWLYYTNVYEPTDGQGQVDDCFFGLDLTTLLRYFDDANEMMRTVAQENGVAMVDLRGHFLGHGYFNEDAELDVHHPNDPTRWFASDCIHPNDRGHHELRRLFVTAAEARPLEAHDEVP